MNVLLCWRGHEPSRAHERGHEISFCVSQNTWLKPHRLGNTHRFTNAHDVQYWKVDAVGHLVDNKLIETEI